MSKAKRTDQECRASLGICAIPPRTYWHGRFLVCIGLFLVVVAASICAFAVALSDDAARDKPSQSLGSLAKAAVAEDVSLKQKRTQEGNTLAVEQQLGQFPPCTEAERELAKMLRGKDEKIDLALANWIIAADVPIFADMTRESYFMQLEAMISEVRQEMSRTRKVAASNGQNINDPQTRCGIFCNAIIKLRFAYREEFAQHDLTPLQDKALHGDPDNTFLAGLLRTKRGSCVSMPLLYLVIGQRLGFPVHLVAIGQHYFIRWQEPGYRINIETTRTDKVWVTDDDSAYVEEEGMTRDQLKGSDLRNLSNREVVGNLFFTRSCYWITTTAKSRTKSWMDLSRAKHLAPDDSAITGTCQAVFDHYGITPGDTVSSLKQKEQKGI